MKLTNIQKRTVGGLAAAILALGINPVVNAETPTIDTDYSVEVSSNDTTPDGFHLTEKPYIKSNLVTAIATEDKGTFYGGLRAGAEIDEEFDRFDVTVGYTNDLETDSDITYDVSAAHFTLPNNSHSFSEYLGTVTFNDLPGSPTVLVGYNTDSKEFGEFAFSKSFQGPYETDVSTSLAIGHDFEDVTSGTGTLKLSKDIGREYEVFGKVVHADNFNGNADTTYTIGFRKDL